MKKMHLYASLNRFILMTTFCLVLSSHAIAASSANELSEVGQEIGYLTGYLAGHDDQVLGRYFDLTVMCVHPFHQYLMDVAEHNFGELFSDDVCDRIRKGFIRGYDDGFHAQPIRVTMLRQTIFKSQAEQQETPDERRSLALFDEHDFRAAIDEYSQRIIKYPGQSIVYYHARAVAHMIRKAYEEAIEDYSHIIRSKSDHTAMYHHMRGRASIRAHHHDAALIDLNKALERGKSDDLLYHDLAYLHFECGERGCYDPKKTIYFAEKAIKIQERPEYFALLVHAYQTLGDDTKVMELSYIAQFFNKFKASPITTLDHLDINVDEEGAYQRYYLDGSIAETGTRDHDQLTGLRYVYYPSGNVLFEDEWHEGNLHGKIRYFNPDGHLLEFRTYNNGLLAGPFRKYYPNGTKREEGMFRNGNLHGIIRKFYANGATKFIDKYDKDHLVYREFYTQEGTKKYRHNYDF